MCNVGQQTYAMPYESYNAMKKISDGYNEDTGKKKLFLWTLIKMYLDDICMTLLTLFDNLIS